MDILPYFGTANVWVIFTQNWAIFQTFVLALAPWVIHQNIGLSLFNGCIGHGSKGEYCRYSYHSHFAYINEA
jgi:hypothetical protein